MINIKIMCNFADRLFGDVLSVPCAGVLIVALLAECHG